MVMKRVQVGMGATPVVFIVDDDEAVRRGLARLVRSVGLDAETYASPRELLAQPRRNASGCIVLDLRMPDLDGLQAQEALTQAGYTMPVVFLTGHADVASSVTAMKAGAIDFLIKPVDHGALLSAIQHAVDRDVAARSERDKAGAVRERFALLTPREREVCDLVVSGLRNKQIADRLGTAEKTVKIHRGQVMQKLRVRSVVELVRMVDRFERRTAAGRASRSASAAAVLRERRSSGARGAGRPQRPSR
jgi:FixJ family two-component response regulator